MLSSGCVDPSNVSPAARDIEAFCSCLRTGFSCPSVSEVTASLLVAILPGSRIVEIVVSVEASGTGDCFLRYFELPIRVRLCHLRLVCSKRREHTNEMSGDGGTRF